MRRRLFQRNCISVPPPEIRAFLGIGMVKAGAPPDAFCENHFQPAGSVTAAGAVVVGAVVGGLVLGAAEFGGLVAVGVGPPFAVLPLGLSSLPTACTTRVISRTSTRRTM